MAVSDQIGGYSCEFVDPISEESVYKVCNLVAREPNLTSCCGNGFCHTCISQVQQDKKPCPEPTCQEPQFTVLQNKGLQKEILALCVHCTREDHGCQWNGKLEDLDAHLNVNTGDCQYVDVECPEKCGQHIEENAQKHLALMAAACMKLSQEFEKKLQQQRDEFQGYLEQKERETRDLLQLEQWREEQIKSLEYKVNSR